ncbi:hypothetical protein BWD162_000640 [Bartonella sp. WD16.2]|nr:hypothetical protein BWD162_000640 [Bartonella sp. WD16.2]
MEFHIGYQINAFYVGITVHNSHYIGLHCFKCPILVNLSLFS